MFGPAGRKSLAPTLREFSNVDTCSVPDALLSYLESTNNDPSVKACKQLAIEALAPQAGEHILDVGCGLGHITIEVARLVGGAGRVTAIDISEIMIREVRKRLSDDYGERVEFRVEDAHRMSLENHTFDGCLVINTLMHCGKPAKVLSEVKRVLKPHGRLVVLEPDWQTLVVSTGNRLADDIAVDAIRQCLTNSRIGHHLPSVMRAVGFRDVLLSSGTITTRDYTRADHAWKIKESIVHAQRAGSLSATQAAIVLNALESSSEADRFYASMTGYVVVASMSMKDREQARQIGFLAQSRFTHGVRSSAKGVFNQPNPNLGGLHEQAGKSIAKRS